MASQCVQTHRDDRKLHVLLQHVETMFGTKNVRQTRSGRQSTAEEFAQNYYEPFNSSTFGLESSNLFANQQGVLSKETSQRTVELVDKVDTQDTGQTVLSQRFDIIAIGDTSNARAKFLSLLCSMKQQEVDKENAKPRDVAATAEFSTMTGVTFGQFSVLADSKGSRVKVDATRNETSEDLMDVTAGTEDQKNNDDTVNDMFNEDLNYFETQSDSTLRLYQYGIMDVVVSPLQMNILKEWIGCTLKPANVGHSCAIIFIDLKKDFVTQALPTLFSCISALRDRVIEISKVLNPDSPDIVLEDFVMANTRYFSNYLIAEALSTTAEKDGKESLISSGVLESFIRRGPDAVDDISEIVARDAGSLAEKIGLPIVLVALNADSVIQQNITADIAEQYPLLKDLNLRDPQSTYEKMSNVSRILRIFCLQIGASLCMIPKEQTLSFNDPTVGSSQVTPTNISKPIKCVLNQFSYTVDVLQKCENRSMSGNDDDEQLELINLCVPSVYGINPHIISDPNLFIPAGWDSKSKIIDEARGNDERHDM